MRRRSPRRRLLVLAGLIATASLVLLGYLQYRLALRPVGEGTARIFEVQTGQSAPSIATALKTTGLIRDRNAFITYINFHGLRGRLKAGTYSLSPFLSGPDIAQALAAGKTLTRRLVIPEGSRLSQIQDLARQQGIPAADFQAALKAPHAQAFLAGKPAAVDLEGYLFPDSYEINAHTTAAILVDQMLAAFGDRVGPEYTQAFAGQGLSLHQGLTLASIVEREVSNPSDRPIVAQVFLKRYRAGQPLGSDVTTAYAAALLGVPFNLDLNSPYNTRKFAGLPPGPICSPGLSALDAVAHPAATDYLYFLAGKDGKTYFARTYAEHQRNIQLHLQ